MIKKVTKGFFMLWKTKLCDIWDIAEVTRVGGHESQCWEKMCSLFRTADVLKESPPLETGIVLEGK
jgi:hypothetical protein